jgi:hypothetical protein
VAVQLAACAAAAAMIRRRDRLLRPQFEAMQRGAAADEDAKDAAPLRKAKRED